jgi:predicted transcriptional regulator
MLENINFTDLVALMRLTPESTVERFGGLINSSFFDASNILGSLKQKGLVDFVTQFPSQSAITVTEQGKQLIAEVQEKAETPFDKLDLEILVQIANTGKTLVDLSSGVNVTSKDLAIHLYKLFTQKFLSYELRNGNITLTLTEKGFITVKEGSPSSNVQQQQAGATTPSQASGAAASPQEQTLLEEQMTQKSDDELKLLEEKILQEKKTDRIILVAIIVIIAIIIFYLYIIGAI